jgi:hypothetical protein
MKQLSSVEIVPTDSRLYRRLIILSGKMSNSKSDSLIFICNCHADGDIYVVTASIIYDLIHTELGSIQATSHRAETWYEQVFKLGGECSGSLLSAIVVC